MSHVELFVLATSSMIVFFSVVYIFDFENRSQKLGFSYCTCIEVLVYIYICVCFFLNGNEKSKCSLFYVS